MTTKPETAADRPTREEREMDKEIQCLEAEREELEGPASGLSWDQIQNGEDLDKQERRRGLLPRLITAAKIKRLELQRERHEAEIRSLEEPSREAFACLEKGRTKRIAAQDKENTAISEHSGIQTRILSREQHIRRVNREIRELRGEA